MNRRLTQMLIAALAMLALPEPAAHGQDRGGGPLARPAAAPSAPPASESPESRPLPTRKPQPAGEARNNAGGGSWMGTLAALAFVAVLGVAASWMLKKIQPAGNERLPSEVLESLGRAPLAGGQQMHLVRCGAKLLLLSVSTSGAQTLSEISDPAEVARLTELCRKGAPRKEASRA